MAAAALALPLLAEGGKAAMQLAQTPVIGWERVETSMKGRRRPRSVVQRTSVQVRAWELGVLGAVGLAGWLLLQPRHGGDGGPVSGNLWIQLFGGLTAPLAKAAGL